MTELVDLTAVAQQEAFRSGEVSARELLDAHVRRIDQRNPELNAIVALDPSHAFERAEAQDAALARGDQLGPLAGLVTAHKDLTDTIDFPTTYGSPIFADHRPVADSLMVARMKAAGALAVGKTNTPEFGAGSHTHNPVHGITRNPWQPERSAGGSSGGAAVGLATGMLALADGSDAGGSLRNPAGWNNIVGFRSSSRLVPSVGPGNAFLPYGIEGPMARTVDDLLLLLEVLAAPDPRDPLHRTVDCQSARQPVERPLRVAYSSSLGGLPVEADVSAVIATVPEWLTSMGWEVVDAEPDMGGVDERFETIRAWYYANGPLGALGERLSEAKAVLGDEVARGRALSAADVWQAQSHLTVLWRRAVEFFTDIDLLVAPVSQVSPFPVEWEYPTEVAGCTMGRYLEWMRSCSRVTMFGLPALSLPAGFTDAGLPVGVQVVGAPLGDAQLLRAARAMESARPQHHHRPPA
ncbi:MAG: amidase family protein [Acidimicrobiales bacterium]